MGYKKPLREARGLTPWFSVEIKEKAGFPTPAKRVEKSGFRTENAITRLSRIRLTTIFKAEYITFRGASFWMGPENSRQSQAQDRYRILRLHNIGGYTIWEVTKRVEVGKLHFYH